MLGRLYDNIMCKENCMYQSRFAPVVLTKLVHPNSAELNVLIEEGGLNDVTVG